MGAVNEDVVPDSDAQTPREAIKEEWLKPFLEPEKIGNTLILKMVVKIRELFFKNELELKEILLQ